MKSKVLLTIIDGCRPDGLAKANTPNIDALWQSGAYSWKAQTVMPSVTLPVHTTMFRGVSPQKHGVGPDNIYVPTASDFPSLVDVAHHAGLQSSMYYSWGQLRDLAAPGSFRTSYCREAIWGKDNDTRIAQLAAEHIVAEQPDFCVLYLGDVDIWGHAAGWMSPEYIAAIEANDRSIGEVLGALDQAGIRDQYTVLVLSDHGGHEHTHGTDMPEDMTIIWMLNGRLIKQNHEIQTPFTMLDTAPTLAYLLDVTPPVTWEGQPVLEAFV
jgi:predicted AlkP superfamily pyrophosphatase or phosphodiesterase